MKRRQKISLAFLTITTIIIISFQISPAQTYSEKLNSGNKKVAAFYYGWYSNTTDYSQTGDVTVKDDRDWRHWNMAKRGWYPPTNACSVNTPLYGWYDSADPAVIEEHLKMAEWAGIDSFVVSYWGQQGFEFDNFKTMLD